MTQKKQVLCDLQVLFSDIQLSNSRALYGENSINEAFDVIEKKFAKDFKGCTLAELRYDEDVENRFAEEIEKYHKENNQELIVVLSHL